MNDDRKVVADQIWQLTATTLKMPHGPERNANNDKLEELRKQADAASKATQQFANNKQNVLLNFIQPGPKASMTATHDPSIPPQMLDTMNRGINRFAQMVGRDILKDNDYSVYMDYVAGQRANYYMGMVNLGNTQIRTVVHEMGHWMEDKFPKVKELAHKFLDRRTAGESNQLLSSLVPGAGYKPDEVTKPDKFINPYVGKDYGADGSEVVSMGLEALYQDAGRFARQDPDHFDLIYRIIHGIL